MNLRKAAEMALEVLEANNKSGWYSQEINTLKKALAQPEQEPIPEGWQLVNRNMTPEQRQLMLRAEEFTVDEMWIMLLAAAPKLEDV